MRLAVGMSIFDLVLKKKNPLPQGNGSFEHCLMLPLQDHADPLPIVRATGALTAAKAGIEKMAKNEYILIRMAINLTSVR
jgi:hypothetical protein